MDIEERLDFLEKRYTAEDVNMFCMQPLVAAGAMADCSLDRRGKEARLVETCCLLCYFGMFLYCVQGDPGPTGPPGFSVSMLLVCMFVHV